MLDAEEHVDVGDGRTVAFVSTTTKAVKIATSIDGSDAFAWVPFSVVHVEDLANVRAGETGRLRVERWLRDKIRKEFSG